MKVLSLTRSPATLAMVCGIALVTGISTVRAKADTWDKKTILTVNQTIQVRDTVLDPGQYVLRLNDSNSDRHIVQIFNADQSHIIGTVLAIPKQRMEPTGDSQFMFWETPPGTARALRAWFYPGDTVGQEFPYPRHLKELAMAAPPALTPLPAPETTTTEPAQPDTTAQPETTAPPETAEQPEAKAEEPHDGETADAAEPSPPAAQDQTPAPAATPESPPVAKQSEELPKTASPYPIIGLSGAVLLGFAGLLRRKRLV